MRKMKFTKYIALLLILATLLSMGVMAAESRASSYLSSYYADVALKNGELSIYYEVLGVKFLDRLGTKRIYIQRKVGTRWTTEDTIQYTDDNSLQGENVAYHSGKVYYTPQYSNATYRAVVSFYGKDSSGSDSAEYTTNEVSVP